MPECPFCLEEIKAGARKCPHCQTAFEPSGERQGSTVYVVDNGLLKFAKFVGAILAIFILVGVYLFSVDIKQVSENVSEARLKVQETLLDIEEEKAELEDQIDEINERVARIEAIEKEIATHRAEAASSAEQVRRILSEARPAGEELQQILFEARTLQGNQVAVAITKREERGITSDRGKLWNVGTELRFVFLDGGDREKGIVREAIGSWALHVNLTFTEVASGEAEIRISFSEPGSWSYQGTDALGVAPDKQTLNYGFLAQISDRGSAMQTALHEFGHVLGLVHEFQNPAAGELFDPEAAKEHFGGPPNFWPESQIEALLTQSTDYPGSRPYDPTSVMNYVFPESVVVPGAKAPQPGNTLSESDIRYVASLYPKS